MSPDELLPPLPIDLERLAAEYGWSLDELLPLLVATEDAPDWTVPRDGGWAQRQRALKAERQDAEDRVTASRG